MMRRDVGPPSRVASFMAALNPSMTVAKGDAAAHMRLRIEEYFGMANILLPGAGEIGVRQIVEVLLGQKRLRRLIIEIEKIFEVLKII